MGDIQFFFRNEAEKQAFLKRRRDETRRKIERRQQDARDERSEIGDKDSFDTFGDNDGSLFGP